MKQLKGLTQLRELHPGAVNGWGIGSLDKLTQLESLDLYSSGMDDLWLKFLKQFPKLKVLNLAATKIDDDGLLQLHDLAQLESLDVSYTDVTEVGVALLRAALPKCKVVFRPKYHYDGKVY